MIRTYVDSGVLIAAARGSGPLGERALAIISDSVSREFVSSDYVKSETLPKPTFFARRAEVRFYEAFFSDVSITFDQSHLVLAFEQACEEGLGWVDALHVVAAELSGCEESVTAEMASSSIRRSKRIRIVSIHS